MAEQAFFFNKDPKDTLTTASSIHTYNFSKTGASSVELLYLLTWISSFAYTQLPDFSLQSPWSVFIACLICPLIYSACRLLCQLQLYPKKHPITLLNSNTTPLDCLLLSIRSIFWDTYYDLEPVL